MSNKFFRYIIIVIISSLFLIESKAQKPIDELYTEIINIDPNQFIVKKDSLWGVIDSSNAIILPIEFQIIEDLKFDLFRVKKKDKYGCIHKNGSIITPIQYKEVELFTYHDGLGPYLKVINENQLAGIFNKIGEVIIPDKYLPNSIELSDARLGYSIEASDGLNQYFFTRYNDFQPVPFIKKESIGGNQVNGVFIYTQKDNQKCIVGGDPRKLCNNAFEYFDEFERIIKNEKEFIVLKKKDSLGQFKFGIREVWWGKCMASIIFDELEFNITEKQIKYFKPSKNEVIIALGFIKKNNSRWIVSNFGVKKIK